MYKQQESGSIATHSETQPAVQTAAVAASVNPRTFRVTVGLFYQEVRGKPLP